MDQYSSRRNEKEADRTKVLYDKLLKEEAHQKNKYDLTNNEINIKKLEVDILKNQDKER